jgi:hypothetical protein
VRAASRSGTILRERKVPAFYKIDKERRLVMTTASGVVGLADGLAHQNKLRNDPDFDPRFSQLMDFTHATRVDLTGEDVRNLAEATIFSPASRRAILAPNDSVYGLARMFEILREMAGERGIRVFRNLDEALEWVLAKSESA